MDVHFIYLPVDGHLDYFLFLAISCFWQIYLLWKFMYKFLHVPKVLFKLKNGI